MRREPGVQPVVGQGGLGNPAGQRLQQFQLLAAQAAVAPGFAIRRKCVGVKRQQIGLSKPVQTLGLGPLVDGRRLFTGLVRFDDQANQPPAWIALTTAKCPHTVDHGVV